MQGTLEIANALILILPGKGLQAVINGNEGEMDETGLEAEGKANGGKSVLFNLKDSNFLRFTKFIMMVGTDEVIGNFY